MKTKTMNDYFKSINKMIEEINKATGVEWTHMETGGGCDCLEYLTESNIFVITDGEPSAPVEDRKSVV